ncbi:M16 family metallopeptidase [Kitasatospora sp. NPDC050543]|uniref:M16 family metallopeptidase n=1 Tax=Kitasatospora sp. NPDC050543 TaxID=3364054 RepID=UPI00378CEC1B
MTRELNETSGIPCLFDTEHSRRTTGLCLAIGYGGRHDPAGLEGSAHLLEHLLMSVPLSGGRSLSERIEALGGQCNASTGPESLLFFAEVLNEDAPAVARWMADAVLRPELSTELLASERRVVLQELAAAAADPSDTVQDLFMAELFAGHPLARPCGGTVDSVGEATVAGLRDIHAHATTTRPLAFAASGGADPAALRQSVASSALAAVDTPAPPATPPQTSRPPMTGTHHTPDRWPDRFCWFVAGARGPAVDDERRYAYTVLAHLLGASPVSVLYRRLRGEHALAYAFRSWSRSYSDAGAWRMMAGSEPDNAPRIVDVLREELARVAGGRLNGEDVEAARRQAVMEVVREAQDPLEHALTLANRRCVQGDPWDPEHEIRTIRRTSAAQLAAAAAEIADSLVVVVDREQA